MEVKRSALPLVAVTIATLLFPCSPDTSPVFKPARNLEDSVNLEHGKLGLITPEFGKEDEFVAYRYLSGLTLDATAANMGRNASVAVGNPPDSPEELWRKARYSVSPPPPNSYFSSYRMSGLSKNVYFLNCLGGAYLTAAQTLADRRQRYHDDAALRSWAEAQDLVFANCSGNAASGKPQYPAAPGPAFSELAAADRRYQLAAAHFYAEDFDNAERMFRDIASDQASPWRSLGDYMVGRTLLREFSLANKPGAVDEARTRLQFVASDPASGTLGASARGLIEHLNAIDHSPETLQSLADRIMSPQSGAPFVKALEESQYLLVADSFHAAVSQPDIPDPFDWVRTLESGDEAHAVSRWRATNRLPWLTLALIHAAGRDDAAADLIAAANLVPADSPAFVTVRYNELRLRMERGETEEPRRQLDRLLASENTQPASVRNAWRALRERLATSFDDFLRWAPRTPTNAGDFSTDPRQSSPILADDSVAFLNYATPLSGIVRAVGSARLPAWSTSELALTGWTRAFILGDYAAMSALLPSVARNHPDWTDDLTPQSGAAAAAWRFRTSLFIARHAQLTPILWVDFRKPIDPNDGWWCAVDEAIAKRQMASQTVAWRVPVAMNLPDAVISPAERAEATTEIARLERLGSAQSVLGPVILAWAKAHPDDPLVPEALHRVVRVVRYGCHEEPDNGRLSKAAFDMLHQRYPGNPWTAKTPYWFK